MKQHTRNILVCFSKEKVLVVLNIELEKRRAALQWDINTEQIIFRNVSCLLERFLS
jgi:hypothetical protein